MSGSTSWISTHFPTDLPRPVLCALDFITSPPSRSFLGLHWYKYSHVEVGGVTDGFWFCGSSFPVDANTKLPVTYHRTLRTILSSTVLGVRPSPSPVDPDATTLEVTYENKLLHCGGLLPIQSASSVLVLCPSVFTATRWCVRPLTAIELAIAFDLPESFSSFFGSAFSGTLQQLPFLYAAPSKLLRLLYSARFYPSLRLLDLPGGEHPQSVNAGNFGCISAAAGCQTVRPAPLSALIPSSDVTPSAVADGNAHVDANLELLLNNGSPASVEGNRQKAAKNDDAPVPTSLWDRLLWLGNTMTPLIWRQAVLYCVAQGKDPLDVLRNNFLLPLWRKHLWRSWSRYYAKRVQQGSYSIDEQLADKAGARECFAYVSKCTWWEWKGGSKLLFWRWPEAIRHLARDGMPTCIKGELPNYRVPQRKERDPQLRELVGAKLANVYEKGYVGKGQVKSLTSYFDVPKGEGDRRMVYDATKCGLNSAIWVPSFSLPDVDTLVDMVEECTWMADIDIGEMFLNFPLDKFLQPYCGVDFGPYLPEVESWLRWLRCAMGLKPSPYVAIRYLLLGSEIIRGWRKDPKNALRYDEVRLNLPGMANYNPRLPWVSKIISNTQRIASDYVGYVDDLRPVGESEAACTQCARRVSSLLGYLGIQDASRKRQGASKVAGVWAGAVVFTSDDGVGVNCTQEKWDKTMNFLQSIRDMLDSGEPINHKMLERIRGFLLYVTRTYPAMVPFLKGIHLTLDSWRPGRDNDGWRLTMSELRARLEFDKGYNIDFAAIHAKGAPEFVTPSSRLDDDIRTLQTLTSFDSPPRRFIRSRLIVSACYGFGDASGSGFGSTIAGVDGLKYQHGLWGRDNNKKSSNYRELRNLVETIEEGVEDGSLEGAELFLFTDNTVAEAAFYKGNISSSKTLFELIVRLRQLEMTGSLKLWVIHVAGKRMIQQGADGLSRGNLLEGVMTGVPMLSYVPLAISGIQRSPNLVAWIRSWTPTPGEVLTTDEWYDKGHGITGGFYNDEGIWIPNSTSSGLFIWDPPPAAARAAIDQLAISRHKRPSLAHVFICPRLFTSMWRKRLYKLADCVVYIPAGSRSFWPDSMFEPLILGLLLPFSSSYPWQHRRSPQVLELEGKLRQVWAKPDGSEQLVLREFFKL